MALSAGTVLALVIAFDHLVVPNWLPPSPTEGHPGQIADIMKSAIQQSRLVPGRLAIFPVLAPKRTVAGRATDEPCHV
jgi:hypothetical protein